MTYTHAGVDVSKTRLDVAFWPAGPSFSIPNSEQGLAELVGRLAADGMRLVVYEATGGYERPLGAALAQAGVPARQVDAWRVRRFAQALGRRVKTDAVDAKMLARFAAEVASAEPDRACPPDPTLAALATLRDQLVAESVRLKTLAQTITLALAATLTAERLELVQRQLKQVTRQMKACIDADPALKRRFDLMHGTPGVGETTAFTLLAQLPELGSRTGKQIASLAGVAPHHSQSGASRGRSAIAGGRSRLRRVLYMAALSAARHNPLWKQWREQLTQRGKPKKLTLVAVMRKLIVTLYAILKTNTPFHAAKP